MDRILEPVRGLLKLGSDDLSRATALVLTALFSLAVLSFVMAGVVGAWEKSEAPASGTQATAVPHKGA